MDCECPGRQISFSLHGSFQTRQYRREEDGRRRRMCRRFVPRPRSGSKSVLQASSRQTVQGKAQEEKEDTGGRADVSKSKPSVQQNCRLGRKRRKRRGRHARSKKKISRKSSRIVELVIGPFVQRHALSRPSRKTPSNEREGPLKYFIIIIRNCLTL